MQTVDPLSAYISELIVHKEARDFHNKKPTIYEGLMRAKSKIPPEEIDPNDLSGLPEAAYKATEAMMKELMGQLLSESTMSVTQLVLGVRTASIADEKEKEELAHLAMMAAHGVLHLTRVCRAGLELVDWEYVADRLIDDGRKQREDPENAVKPNSIDGPDSEDDNNPPDNAKTAEAFIAKFTEAGVPVTLTAKINLGEVDPERDEIIKKTIKNIAAAQTPDELKTCLDNFVLDAKAAIKKRAARRAENAETKPDDSETAQ
jgi:hypothetical protein